MQIEQALKHCLDFSAARKVPPDPVADVSDALSKVSMGKAFLCAVWMVGMYH